MSKRMSAGKVRKAYQFIEAHQRDYPVRVHCEVLEVAPSGYYGWPEHPLSNRAQEDARLLRLIRASFVASHGIYGAARVFLDLREAGETCSKHRIERLMRENGLRAVHGYRTRRVHVSKPSVLIPNVLKRQFSVSKPNVVWVTDITYIRTWQGWLYLAVVLDLYSRRVVGWATRATIHREVVLDAAFMAVRRRRPRRTLIHLDQGTQYESGAWRRSCKANRLEPSMGRRGNCWDNAVAESFFSSLKKERVKSISITIETLRPKTSPNTLSRSTVEPGVTATSAALALNALKQSIGGVGAVSTKCWELQIALRAPPRYLERNKDSQSEHVQTASIRVWPAASRRIRALLHRARLRSWHGPVYCLMGFAGCSRRMGRAGQGTRHACRDRRQARQQRSHATDVRVPVVAEVRRQG